MSGLLSKILTNGTRQLVATVPECDYGLINVMVLNPTVSDSPVKLWLSTQATPSEVDLIESDTILVARGGKLELSCVTVSQGEVLYIEASAGLVVRVTSILENT